MIRVNGEVQLEIGFHAEYPKAPQNDEVLRRLLAVESAWRPELGDEAVAGEFIGRAGWRRISEIWPAPDSVVIDEAIETAARLADYVIALEPARRAALGRTGPQSRPNSCTLAISRMVANVQNVPVIT